MTAGGTIVRWPNGVEAKLFGAHTPEDVERLRSGGNRCIAWVEELAAWRYIEECWQHMRYGLRLGPWPHVLASTTPKSLRLIKQLNKRAKEEEGRRNPYIVITRGTTADNPHLDTRVKSDLYDDYGGTRLGRQELSGEILEDVEHALWTPEDIETWRLRVVEQPPRYNRILVGVDPAAKEGGDDTGIIVASMLPTLNQWPQAPINWNYFDRQHFFVLADYSVNGKPEIWGRRVVEAMNDFDAHGVIAEVNNGGEMVEHTIHTVDDTIPVKSVHATRGKERRAEPISALYQQGRGHHIGVLAKLEDQMTTWDSIEPDPSWSPDLMDAMVWAATELVTGHVKARHSRPTVDPRLIGRR
jgi:phage terminase large subunit-like protein